ncbi:MAG: hypothetical protein J7K49_00730 [Thaumarchaeota archaeon]|nr:hypothetical protein [Nitrososphaerota archaeon]
MRDDEIKDIIKKLGHTLGFEVEEEWTPGPLRMEDRQTTYIPRIDIIWYKKMTPKFLKFLEIVKEKMFKNLKESEDILPRYRDIDKEIVIGFELELSDRATKYILGDIANLSRICDYGFIVVRNVENLVRRSIKASRAFSILHGASRVFIIDPDDLREILRSLESKPQHKTSRSQLPKDRG